MPPITPPEIAPILGALPFEEGVGVGVIGMHIDRGHSLHGFIGVIKLHSDTVRSQSGHTNFLEVSQTMHCVGSAGAGDMMGELLVLGTECQ